MVVARSSVALGALACALLDACADPEQPTDLRTHGSPNVTAVLVASDLRTAVDPGFPSGSHDLDRLIESATYCRIGDEKRPGVVNLPTITTLQVCSEDLDAPADTPGTAPAAPPTWYARVVFDQLLDPNIEDLIPELDDMMKPTGRMVGSFLRTQPVTLTCGGVDVAYDGYYVPNGNRISWPVGPSLFIQPISATSVPTGATCEIAIKDAVHSKHDLASVPIDQRRYRFEIAAMALRFSDPDPGAGPPGAITISPDAPISFFWTAAFTTLPAATEIKIFAAPNLPGTGTEVADGAPDLSVCGTGGTAVPPADIVTAVRPPLADTPAAITAATTALVMELGLASPAPHRWAPRTTYRVELGPGARITPRQGGPDGTFPPGYKLCFHTRAAPM